MAGKTSDAITHSILNTLGNAAPIAMGGLYQALAQTLGNTAQNMSTAQQQNNVIAQAATTLNINQRSNNKAIGSKPAVKILKQQKAVSPQVVVEKEEPRLHLHSHRPLKSFTRNFDLPSANAMPVHLVGCS